jgi:hypothetical protein
MKPGGGEADEAKEDLIRRNLFFFHLMAMKITTQFVLTSNVKSFV